MAFGAGGTARLARKAVLRSAEDPAEAAVAVVLSVIAADAFVSDVVGAAHVLSTSPAGRTPDVLAVLEYAEAPGGTVGQRFRDVARLLGSPETSPDARRWKDLDVLVALRNEITHDGPRRPEVRGRERGCMGAVLRHLEHRGVVPRLSKSRTRSRSTADAIAHGPEVARWAYCTARASVRGLIAGTLARPLVVLVHMTLHGWDGEPEVPVAEWR